MKRWFSIVFVFLLCAAYPVHADVMNLSASAGLETWYADVTTTIGPVTGTTSALAESGNSTSAITETGWAAEATDSWAYSSSEVSAVAAGTTMDVDMRWDNSYSSNGPTDVVKGANAGSAFTYVHGESQDTTVDISWNLAYYLDAYETMDYQIVLEYSDNTPMGGGSIILDSLTVDNLNGSAGVSDTWTNSYSFDLGALTTRAFTLSIIGTSSYGSYVGSMTGGIDFGDVTPAPPTPSTDPVPEPSTMLLLGCGLMGLARSRKNKKG